MVFFFLLLHRCAAAARPKKILIEISDRQKMADVVDVIKLSLEKLYLRQVLKLYNR